jgi:hypothetical protein
LVTEGVCRDKGYLGAEQGLAQDRQAVAEQGLAQDRQAVAEQGLAQDRQAVAEQAQLQASFSAFSRERVDTDLKCATNLGTVQLRN